MNHLAELGGYRTSVEWERDAGYDHKALSRLRSGKGGVDGYNLLKLIRAVAARQTLSAEGSPEQTALAATPERAQEVRMGSILDQVESLTGLVARALEMLDESQKRIEENQARIDQNQRRIDELFQSRVERRGCVGE